LSIWQRRRLIDSQRPVPQPRSAIGRADLTGLRVWESSRVLARYLHGLHRDGALRGLLGCELGSGTGLAGLATAAMGMEV
jgi:predicted nicotinamide N-methyase